MRPELQRAWVQQAQLDAERGDKRMQHWRGVIASACEQSGRARLPTLQAPTALADWLAQSGTERVLYLDPQAETGLRDLAPDKGFALVVGPEGGLGERDLHAAARARFDQHAEDDAHRP